LLSVDYTSTCGWKTCDDRCPWEFTSFDYNAFGQVDFSRGIYIVFFWYIVLPLAIGVLVMELLTRRFFSQVISLELSTGIPMLYIFKEGKFIRRGSPAGPSEAGVYAYTKVRIFSVSQLEIIWHNKYSDSICILQNKLTYLGA
jgi:hypothetical protein